MRKYHITTWAVLSLAVAGWAAVCNLFPIYFQRDDMRWILDWSMNNTWIDAFWVRDPHWDNAGRFLPITRLFWMTQQRLFGLHEWPYQFLLGVLFIFSLYFLFLLVKRMHQLPSAILAVLIWPLAFQSLMTTLFWFIDICHIAEMLFVCAGLYIFARSMGTSRGGVWLSLFFMLLAMLTREPSRIILPAMLAVYLGVEGPRSLHWSWPKTILMAALPVLFGAIYVLFFHNYGLTSKELGLGDSSLLAGILVRLSFYGQMLVCGMGGLVLLFPALYVILKRVSPMSIALPGAAVLSLLLIFLRWHYVGLIILFAGGCCLPIRLWFLLPWVFVPLAGLLIVRDIIPTYLFELSFGAAALAGTQLAILLKDGLGWLPSLRLPRAIAITGTVILLGCGLGGAGLKIGRLADLLRLRSDMTMVLKQATPALQQLPPGATLAVVNYEAMGIRFMEDMIHWSQEEKIRSQSALVPKMWATSWLRVIGRPDVTIADWGSHPPDAFLLLITPKERAFFFQQNLPYETIAHSVRGQASLDLVHLLPTP